MRRREQLMGWCRGRRHYRSEGSLVASNSIEQRLSQVNWRTESKLRIMNGTIRTLFRTNLDVSVARTEEPRDVTGICAPLPTVIKEEAAGRRERSIPSEECMCVEAPVSITHVFPSSAIC